MEAPKIGGPVRPHTLNIPKVGLGLTLNRRCNDVCYDPPLTNAISFDDGEEGKAVGSFFGIHI